MPDEPQIAVATSEGACETWRDVRVRASRLLTACPYLPLLPLSALVVLPSFYFDSDTWFLLATGREISETGVIPTENVFSQTEGLSIIVQQWLYCVIVWVVYDHLGRLGLAALVLATQCLALSLFWRLTARWTGRLEKRGLLLAFAFILTLPLMTCRPSAITAVLCVIEVDALERYRADKDARHLLKLPVLMVAEANLHSSMLIAHLIFAAPYIFPDDPRHWWRHLRWRLVGVLATLPLVSCLNPYGWRGAAYLFLSYGTATGIGIQELQSAPVWSGWGLVWVAEVVCVVLWAIRAPRPLSPARASAAILGVVLAAPHLRNLWLPLFGIAPLLADLIPDFTMSELDEGGRAFRALFAALCIVDALINASAMLKVEDSTLAPVLAVEALEEVDGEVILYNNFNSGGYLEFMGYEVYIDQRPEIWAYRVNEASDRIDEYLCALNGIDEDGSAFDCAAFIESYGFTHLIVYKEEPLAGYLAASDDFELLVEGSDYLVYGRAG